jgi:hypothetical protein
MCCVLCCAVLWPPSSSALQGEDPHNQHCIRLGGLTETRDIIRRSRRIMFVACGTSYHSALAARSTVSCVGQAFGCCWQPGRNAAARACATHFAACLLSDSCCCCCLSPD